MHFFIQKLRVVNFLSFFGEYEINLKPFSAVMCNYYKGKDDLLRAFEFVFGAELSHIKVETPLDLVNKVLRQKFITDREVQSYVEVTIKLVSENKLLKFCKSIKNGNKDGRIEHKLSGVITSRILYEEKLHSLSLHIKQKNLIFYGHYFNNAIWGSSEDLEMIIDTCLRENYLYDEWKKVQREVEHLTELKRRAADKKFHAIRNSHLTISKYTLKYESVSADRETIRLKILKDFIEGHSEGSSPSMTSPTEMEIEETEDEGKEKGVVISELEMEIESLVKKLHELKLKEGILTSHLYHEEIKLTEKPENGNLIQNRISEIKGKVREKGIQRCLIEKQIEDVESELGFLSVKISYGLISLYEIEVMNFLQNRLTSYGRLVDYLQPSRYIPILKQIIGSDTFYAHLCDSVEIAIHCMYLMTVLKYEQRENFLIFNNHSHKLRDLLTTSGEKGVGINSLEELLIFLCKLKHYGVIDEVPIIFQKHFDFDDDDLPPPDDYVLYIQNGLHFNSEGLISYKPDENTFLVDTEMELQKALIQLKTEEEAKHQERKELLFLKWQNQREMNFLENDIFYLKQKLKKPTQQPLTVGESPEITEIYEEFSDIFTQYTEGWQESERELQLAEEQFLLEGSQESSKLSSTSSDQFVDGILKDLEEVISEKTETEKKLESFNKELRKFSAGPFYMLKLQNRSVRFDHGSDKSRLFFEKEFKKIKKLMTEDDIEDFLGNREWRKTLITSLIKNLEEIKKSLKTAIESFENITNARKENFYPILKHCSHYLSSTFHRLINDALPFIDLNFNSGEEKLQITSCMGDDRINIVEIKHFNTFLKFISVLSVFLEIAVFGKIPVIIFDDIEEYFPPYIDNLEAVLNSNTIESIIPDDQNSRFHLLMRIGQVLAYYISKNTPGKQVRCNGNNATDISGPMQIIYFAKEDFINAAEHYIWIHNQVLSEEYISEDCDSYSKIVEMNVNTIPN